MARYSYACGEGGCGQAGEGARWQALRHALALDTAMRDGRIQPGDLVMFEAMGGGFTWGASLVRF